MARGRTKQLTESILGQHIALSVAAGLARTHLSPDPPKVYDAQHLTELLDVIARALAKVAPLYVRDASDADPRALTPEEHEIASVRNGASVLVLKTGRTFSSVTMKRGDLRQAVAVLKAVGIPELAVARPRDPQPSAPPAHNGHELLELVAQVEALLKPPLVAGQFERANRSALLIARRSPQGRISNLAMQLMSCLHEARGADELPDKCRVVLVRLRAVLEEPAQP